MYLRCSTPRLTVRPIQLGDAPFMHKLMNTKGWLEFIGDRHIHNIPQAEAYIQKMLDHPGYYYHLIEEKEGAIPVGVLSFMHRENEDYPDLGFALLPDYMGNGFAYEASHEFLNQLDKSGQYKKVIALTKPNNTGSMKLLEKLGFRFLKTKVNPAESLTYYSYLIPS